MKLSKLANKNKRVIKKKLGAQGNYKSLFVTGATALSAMAVRKGSEFIWKKVTHREAPKNPADHDVSWRDALMWTILTGLTASLVRVIIMRNVSIGLEEDA